LLFEVDEWGRPPGEYFPNDVLNLLGAKRQSNIPLTGDASVAWFVRAPQARSQHKP